MSKQSMTLKQNLERSKEVAGAYFRQGLHELGNALYPPGTAAQSPEYGMVGTKLPSEIAQDMKGEAPGGAHKEPSILDRHIEEAKAQVETQARQAPERSEDRTGGVHGPKEPERE